MNFIDDLPVSALTDDEYKQAIVNIVIMLVIDLKNLLIMISI